MNLHLTPRINKIRSKDRCSACNKLDKAIADKISDLYRFSIHSVTGILGSDRDRTEIDHALSQEETQVRNVFYGLPKRVPPVIGQIEFRLILSYKPL